MNMSRLTVRSVFLSNICRPPASSPPPVAAAGAAGTGDWRRGFTSGEPPDALGGFVPEPGAIDEGVELLVLLRFSAAALASAFGVGLLPRLPVADARLPPAGAATEPPSSRRLMGEFRAVAAPLADAAGGPGGAAWDWLWPPRWPDMEMEGTGGRFCEERWSGWDRAEEKDTPPPATRPEAAVDLAAAAGFLNAIDCEGGEGFFQIVRSMSESSSFSSSEPRRRPLAQDFVIAACRSSSSLEELASLQAASSRSASTMSSSTS
mmetsp:Transcript_77004/g.160234  ORF Transcript_77004/g.160234 Transcript_77004/m.160234 type:complete len:263 (-) Transcript_77004:980-1768(-)